MKPRHGWLAIGLLMCIFGLFNAGGAPAQVSEERLAAVRASAESAKSFADRLPDHTRRMLSAGAMNLANLGDTWAQVEPVLRAGRAASRAAAAAALVEEAVAPRSITAPGTQVNDPSLDVVFSSFTGFTQSETSTAWCGKNVVVGYNDTGTLLDTIIFGSGGVSLNSVARSTNSGATFREGLLNPGPTTTDLLSGDPVLGCSDQNTFYYASLLEETTTSDISVSRSNDGGLSWANPVAAVAKDKHTHFLDKPWFAVDPTGIPTSSPANLFVTYTDFDSSGALCGSGNVRTAIELVRSMDGGASWSAPVVVREVCAAGKGGVSVQGSQAVVGPDGSVNVAWEEATSDPGTGAFIGEVQNFNKSTDHGTTFGASPVTVASGVIPVGAAGFFQGMIRNSEFPSLAVDRSGGKHNGDLYIVWNDGRNLCVEDVVVPSDPLAPGAYCYADIVGVRSTDGGATWSTPVRINQNKKPLRSGLGSDQFMPPVAVSKSGKVAVCFYDRRNDPRNFLIGRSCAFSTNQGKTIAEIPVATDGWPSVTLQDILTAPGYMGDYDGLASDFLHKVDGFIGTFGENSKGEPNVRAKKF